MRVITLLIGVFIVLSCRAQQVVPLNTFMEDIPPNAHVKDLNNELVPYVGTYKANFEDKEITLFITKEENRIVEYTDQNFYRDALVVKYIVKSSSGVMLQDTQSMNFTSNQKFHIIYSIRTRPSQNTVIFNYRGTNCGIGWGSIELKKLSDTQLSWEYRPNSSLIDSNTCPPSTDKTVYLPVTKDLIFTKQ